MSSSDANSGAQDILSPEVLAEIYQEVQRTRDAMALTPMAGGEALESFLGHYLDSLIQLKTADLLAELEANAPSKAPKENWADKFDEEPEEELRDPHDDDDALMEEDAVPSALEEPHVPMEVVVLGVQHRVLYCPRIR